EGRVLARVPHLLRLPGHARLIPTEHRHWRAGWRHRSPTGRRRLLSHRDPWFAAEVSSPDLAPAIRRAGVLVATVACAFAAASCSATVTTARRATTEQAPATTTPTAVEQTGWTTLSRSTRGIAIDLRTLTTTDGSAMTLVRFLAGQ